MFDGWLNKYKAFIVILLIAVIAAGAAVLFSKHPWQSQAIEISLTTPTPELPAEIEVYVDGAVTSPGWYPLREGDSLGQLLLAAGGTKSDADPAKIKLYIYKVAETTEAQKIDLNRAEAWLLEALPGIGPTLAQRIVDYRNKNGPFLRVDDLKRVEGIEDQTYEKLKGLVTVG